MSLKELLGEELYNQVTEKLGDKKIDIVNDGKWLPKDKFDEVNEEKKQYKEMLKERDEQLTDIKNKVKDSDELTTKITELQQTNEKTVSEYENKLKEQSFTFALEREIAKSEAKNVKAVKALLQMNTIKYEEEKFIGLEEQITALKQSDAYLFGTGIHGRKPHETPNHVPTHNPWSKDSLNLTEQGKLLKTDPDLAKKLMAQAGQ